MLKDEFVNDIPPCRPERDVMRDLYQCVLSVVLQVNLLFTTYQTPSNHSVKYFVCIDRVQFSKFS